MSNETSSVTTRSQVCPYCGEVRRGPANDWTCVGCGAVLHVHPELESKIAGVKVSPPNPGGTALSKRLWAAALALGDKFPEQLAELLEELDKEMEVLIICQSKNENTPTRVKYIARENLAGINHHVELL